MCAGSDSVDPAHAFVGDDGVEAAAVAGHGPALDEAGGLHAIDRPGEAAGGERRLGRQVAHPQLVVRRAGQPDEQLEPLPGQPGVIEAALQERAEPGAGLEQEAGQRQAFVGEGVTAVGAHAADDTGVCSCVSQLSDSYSACYRKYCASKEGNRHEPDHPTEADPDRRRRRVARAGDYTLDRSHTDIGFTVRHLMVSKVRGSFREFDGSVHHRRRPAGVVGRGRHRPRQRRDPRPGPRRSPPRSPTSSTWPTTRR